GPNTTTPIVGGVRSATTVSPAQAGQNFGALGGGQLGQTPGAITASSIANVPQNSSVVLIPLPRLSSILVATFASRMQDIQSEIRWLDQNYAGDARAVAFPLKNQSASRVANLVQQFYSTRFPQEGLAQNQIRITFDENSNTVYVQAAVADLQEIGNLIER